MLFQQPKQDLIEKIYLWEEKLREIAAEKALNSQKRLRIAMIENNKSKQDEEIILNIKEENEQKLNSINEITEVIKNVELSKKVLILNYIYDNSQLQLNRMNIKMMELNYLEDFKHISLDKRISPLILASYLGRLEIVMRLLQSKNIDINMCSDDCGFTPLNAACKGGFFEIVEFLIRKGANVHKANIYGQTPFFHCFSRLEEDSNYFENKYLCLKLAEFLLDKGANIDDIVNIEKGYTTLMVFCAVKSNLTPRELDLNKSCIRFLIENGADISKISKKGKTVFQILSKHPNSEEIASLIKNTIVKRMKFEELSEKQTQQDFLLEGLDHDKKPYSKIQIAEDDCRLEGITRESSSCCSIFSFFSF